MERIARSREEEMLTDELGHSAPWECDLPGPFLSSETYSLKTIINPVALGLGGCIH